jgi:fatty acid desaturase
VPRSSSCNSGIAARLAGYCSRNICVFPALAALTGYSALKVALGNMLADAINNYWIAFTIQATHFTEPLQPEQALQHKGRWYLSQLDSSVNFKGSRRMSILWGHLNYQIEHHLFPDIPSRHYPDMAKEVKAVCAKYNIPTSATRAGARRSAILSA